MRKSSLPSRDYSLSAFVPSKEKFNKFSSEEKADYVKKSTQDIKGELRSTTLLSASVIDNFYKNQIGLSKQKVISDDMRNMKEDMNNMKEDMNNKMEDINDKMEDMNNNSEDMNDMMDGIKNKMAENEKITEEINDMMEDMNENADKNIIREDIMEDINNKIEDFNNNEEDINNMMDDMNSKMNNQSQGSSLSTPQDSSSGNLETPDSSVEELDIDFADDSRLLDTLEESPKSVILSAITFPLALGLTYLSEVRSHRKQAAEIKNNYKIKEDPGLAAEYNQHRNAMMFKIVAVSLYLVGVGLLVAASIVTGGVVPLLIGALSVLGVAMGMNLYDKISQWKKEGTLTATKVVFQVLINLLSPTIATVGVFATPALIVGGFFSEKCKETLYRLV